MEQAKQSQRPPKWTGMVLTKLDGTARGGVVIGIAEEFKIPVRFIGVGDNRKTFRCSMPWSSSTPCSPLHLAKKPQKHEGPIPQRAAARTSSPWAAAKNTFDSEVLMRQLKANDFDVTHDTLSKGHRSSSSTPAASSRAPSSRALTPSSSSPMRSKTGGSSASMSPDA